MRFDVQRKDAYAALFTEGRPAVEGVARAVAQLDGSVEEAGVSRSTAAVERILKVLSRAQCTAFAAGGPVAKRRVQGVEDAPWWNESCALARTAVMACERRSDAFRAARSVYHRAKCDAIQADRLRYFESLVEGPGSSNSRALGISPRGCGFVSHPEQFFRPSHAFDLTRPGSGIPL